MDETAAKSALLRSPNKVFTRIASSNALRILRISDNRPPPAKFPVTRPEGREGCGKRHFESEDHSDSIFIHSAGFVRLLSKNFTSTVFPSLMSENAPRVLDFLTLDRSR